MQFLLCQLAFLGRFLILLFPLFFYEFDFSIDGFGLVPADLPSPTLLQQSSLNNLVQALLMVDD